MDYGLRFLPANPRALPQPRPIGPRPAASTSTKAFGGDPINRRDLLGLMTGDNPEIAEEIRMCDPKLNGTGPPSLSATRSFTTLIVSDDPSDPQASDRMFTWTINSRHSCLELGYQQRSDQTRKAGEIPKSEWVPNKKIAMSCATSIRQRSRGPTTTIREEPIWRADLREDRKNRSAGWMKAVLAGTIRTGVLQAEARKTEGFYEAATLFLRCSGWQTLDSPSLNQLTLYLMDLRIFLQGFSWMDKEQSVMDIHTM